MTPRIARRAIIHLAIASALLVQVVHAVHHRVICYDREGAQEECADLLGRCQCHVHDRDGRPDHPVGENPGFSGGRAFLPCNDISVGQMWRGSRPLPSASAAADVLSVMPDNRSGQLHPDRHVAFPSSGPSPPPGGSSRCSRFSTWRC